MNLDSIDLQKVVEIAKTAGDKIMEIYSRDFSVEYKDDGSPLTEADTLSNEIITSSLQKIYPDIPILSEESEETPYEIRKEWSKFWLIDPIDGTKGFVNRDGDFTVNIALIENSEPILGVVYAPVTDEIYYSKKGSGAFKNGEKLPLTLERESLVVVASKNHLNRETELFIKSLKESYPDLILSSRGSSLKLCMMAEGLADIYPRLSPTSEWDIGAGDAILREVGKMVYQYSDEVEPTDYLEKNKREKLTPLQYDKKDLINPNFVVVDI